MSYTANGVKFTREVFSSPVDQVIVVRITADKPGQISFTAGMATPQRATVEVEGPDTLIMRGVNGEAKGIEGALKFQARVRVLAQGGRTTTAGDKVSVTAADSATLLIAAATSYRKYNDVGGDPEPPVKNWIAAASKRPFAALRSDHVAEHQRLFRRVDLDLGTTEARPPADRRADQGFRRRQRSATGGPLFPVRPLLADRQFAARRAARQSAGHLEREHEPALGEQIHDQHQHRDELLAGRDVQSRPSASSRWSAWSWTDRDRRERPRKDPLRRARLGVPSQHRPVARHRADRRAGWGIWPTGGAWLCKHLWDHYRIQRRQGVPGQSLSR